MADEIDRDLEVNERCLNRLIARAGSRPSSEISRMFCLKCEETIPEKRRQLISGVKLCVTCQSATE
ncbi:TraR/DksA family transcriptional regulator [Erwinia psidii]|uniref:TraR/DksA C4-type zinc finger protein n=1 Tax=Erwinia psidii TaxID=69224 RepID=UPI002B4704C8|nr:TraR/DksA C4-type zinc finger protein [Erwinia psidii]MCX8965983.1 TraR/DksA family transcriptional regulator [Erwinia psidii]